MHGVRTNPNSNIPALSLSDNNNEKRVSTYWVENGSYLKLRTIQLGYNLPKSMTNRLAMQRFTFLPQCAELINYT